MFYFISHLDLVYVCSFRFCLLVLLCIFFRFPVCGFPSLSSVFLFRSTFGTAVALSLLRFAIVLSLAISSSFPLSFFRLASAVPLVVPLAVSFPFGWTVTDLDSFRFVT
ncbi:hypothetical protein BB560_006012 [Smittium megazygosporum]|uniref:Uncharacterized protein n=1 Tax=Smittium megazygosporum TaxID=133381 RepID=A0A2T9YL19_9FUNG|nr:hypothetical protein BB560_006012 [Smittium megazygosporum]